MNRPPGSTTQPSSPPTAPAIIIWIEKTYHRRRRQDRLGRLTPIEFETLLQTAHAA